MSNYSTNSSLRAYQVRLDRMMQRSVIESLRAEQVRRQRYEDPNYEPVITDPKALAELQDRRDHANVWLEASGLGPCALRRERKREEQNRAALWNYVIARANGRID